MADEIKGEEQISFEVALQKLEETVTELEQGDLPLEEALEHFKEGVRLVKICRGRLKDAETVIEQLAGENGGEEPSPPEEPEGEE